MLKRVLSHFMKTCECGCGERYPRFLCVRLTHGGTSEYVYWRHHARVYGEDIDG